MKPRILARNSWFFLLITTYFFNLLLKFFIKNNWIFLVPRRDLRELSSLRSIIKSRVTLCHIWKDSASSFSNKVRIYGNICYSSYWAGWLLILSLFRLSLCLILLLLLLIILRSHFFFRLTKCSYSERVSFKHYLLFNIVLRIWLMI
jgi:hypothetical protein